MCPEMAAAPVRSSLLKHTDCLNELFPGRTDTKPDVDYVGADNSG